MYHRQCKIQKPILAYYIETLMYKIRISISMRQKCAPEFLKHCSLFQSWTASKLGLDLTRLVLEMPPAFMQSWISSGEVTWSGWAHLVGSSLSSCLPSASLLTQLCHLLNWFKALIQEKTSHRQSYSAPAGDQIPTASMVCPRGKRNPGVTVARGILKN